MLVDSNVMDPKGFFRICLFTNFGSTSGSGFGAGMLSKRHLDAQINQLLFVLQKVCNPSKNFLIIKISATQFMLENNFISDPALV
jgi:hypothetical protein